jgi:hypothetical protein
VRDKVSTFDVAPEVVRPRLLLDIPCASRPPPSLQQIQKFLEIKDAQRA